MDQAEAEQLLADQLARLDDAARPVWDRYGLAVPVAVPCIRRDIGGSPTEPEPIYCFARAGDEVLIYDDVEEEFGTGILDKDGVLRKWGTYGEELRWSLHHFPRSSTSEATAPA